jgi:hypothetical protein
MVIKVGKSSFNADYLMSVTKDEAKKALKHIPENVVVMAWEQANPSGRKKKTTKSSK